MVSVVRTPILSQKGVHASTPQLVLLRLSWRRSCSRFDYHLSPPANGAGWPAGRPPTTKNRCTAIGDHRRRRRPRYQNGALDRWPPPVNIAGRMMKTFPGVDKASCFSVGMQRVNGQPNCIIHRRSEPETSPIDLHSAGLCLHRKY